MVNLSTLLFKKNLREVKNNWPQFLAVILIAALAITLFSGLTSSWKCLEERVTRLNNETNFLDVITYVDFLHESPESFKENISSLSDVQGRIGVSGYLENKVVNILLSDGIPKISKPLILEEGVDGKGLFITSNLASSFNLKKGDKVSISFSSIDMFDEFFLSQIDTLGSKNIFREDLILSFTISGTMIHAESTQKTSISSGLIEMDLDTFYEAMGEVIDANYGSNSPLLKQMINGKLPINQLVIKTNNQDQTIQELETYFLTSETNLLMSFKASNLPSQKVVQADIIQGKKLTYVFPIIFFLVSILVILTTTTQLIYREKGLIGTMKAIGIGKKMITWHYMKFSMLILSIGGIIGLVVGPLLIPSIMGIKYDILYLLPNSRLSFFEPISLLIFLGMLLVASLVSYLVTYKEIKKTPKESLSGEQKIIYKKEAHLMKKAPWSLKLAIRNIFRNKARDLMVIVGLTGCTALLLAGFGITNTLNHSIDQELYVNFPYDINVTLKANPEDALAEIEKLDVVSEAYTKFPIKVNGTNLKDSNLFIVSPSSKIISFYKPGSVVLTKKIADLAGIKVGDSFSIIYSQKKVDFTCDEIFDSALTQGIFIDYKMGESITLNSTNVWIKTDRDVKEMDKQILAIAGVSDCYDILTYKEQAQNILGSVDMITSTLKIFAALLAIVVLYNLALLNYKERTRDLATLKVLGYSQVEIVSSLVIEMMILTSIGALIGLTLGKPIMKLLLMINENEILTFIYHIKPISYVLAFLLTFITSLLVNIFLGRTVRKIPMVESLKSVE